MFAGRRAEPVALDRSRSRPIGAAFAIVRPRWRRQQSRRICERPSVHAAVGDEPGPNGPGQANQQRDDHCGTDQAPNDVDCHDDPRGTATAHMELIGTAAFRFGADLRGRKGGHQSPMSASNQQVPYFDPGFTDGFAHLVPPMKAPLPVNGRQPASERVGRRREQYSLSRSMASHRRWRFVLIQVKAIRSSRAYWGSETA